MAKGIPKRDSSGNGRRANKGRGGCKTPPADRVDIADAMAHSLKKWIGLRPKNLAKHECLVTEKNKSWGRYIRSKNGIGAMNIGMDTCACCRHHFKILERSCDGCPLDNCIPASEIYNDTLNPEPMIKHIKEKIQHNANTTK